MLQQTIETKDPPRVGGPRQHKETPERYTYNTPYLPECQVSPVDPQTDNPPFNYLGEEVKDPLPERPEDDPVGDGDLSPVQLRAKCGNIISFKPKGWKKAKGVDVVRAVFHCHQWRDGFCPPCFNDRVIEYQNRIINAIYERGLTIRVVELEVAHLGLLAELDRPDYLRLPTSAEGEPETGWFFYDASKTDARIGKPVSMHDDSYTEDVTAWEHWQTAINSRIGKRPSGTLGKMDDEPEPESTPSEEVAYTEIVKLNIAYIKPSQLGLSSYADIDVAMDALMEANKLVKNREMYNASDVERMFVDYANQAFVLMRKKGLNVKASVEMELEVKTRIRYGRSGTVLIASILRKKDGDVPDGWPPGQSGA